MKVILNYFLFTGHIKALHAQPYRANSYRSSANSKSCSFLSYFTLWAKELDVCRWRKRGHLVQPHSEIQRKVFGYCGKACCYVRGEG